MNEAHRFRLADEAATRGFTLRVYDEIGSTNDEAMRRARDGESRSLWLVANSQTHGRGRHGRTWQSPPGNLYASLLLVDAVAPAAAPQLGFVAGIALAHSLRACLDDDRCQRLRLKWPNDILFDGAKLAGILLESTMRADGSFASIVGIGVNCARRPEGLAYRVTALREIGAQSSLPEEIFLRLSAEFSLGLDRFARGAGFAEIRTEWLSLAAGLNGPLRVETAQGTVEGRFLGIDPTGRLMLATADGDRLIEAGDVWLGAEVGGAVT